jgi:hypothetical protein
VVEVTVQKGKGGPTEKEQINLDTFIDIKGWKSQGNRLSLNKVKKVTFVSAEEFLIKEKPKAELPELDFGDGETYEQEVEDMEESPIAKAGLLKKSTVNSPQTTDKESTKPKQGEVKIGTEIEWDLEAEQNKKKAKKKDDTEQGSLF